MSNYSNISFHKFVDDELDKRGFKIVPVTGEFAEKRIDDIMELANSVLREYKDKYNWHEESREYFLNPLTDKWKYSFAVTDKNDKLQFLNFSSLYDQVIHYHFSYCRKESRGKDLAKLHVIKISQTGIDSGLTMQEGYWPKNNNGSLILYLSLGFEIQSIRKETELLLKAPLIKARDSAYKMLLGKYVSA